MQPLDIVIGIIVLAVIVAVIVVYRKRHPSETDKEWADKFLESLSDYMYKEILNIIAQTDFSQFENINDANKYLIELIYNTIWAFVEDKLAEASTQGIMPVLAAKIITKDYVEAFIKTILEKMDFEKKFIDAYTNPTKFDVDAIVEEDKKLAIEFANENEYFENGEAKEEDLPKAEETTKQYQDPLVEGDVQKIIPPSEEDEIPLSENDDTVEIVDDSALTEEEIVAGIHFNKNGRKIDKRGRFVKG